MSLQSLEEMKRTIIFRTNNEAMLRLAKSKRTRCDCTSLVVHDYWDGRYYFHTMMCASVKNRPADEPLSVACFVWSSHMNIDQSE